MSSFSVRHAGECDIGILQSIEYPIDGNIHFKLFYYALSKLLEQVDICCPSDQIGIFVGLDPNFNATVDKNGEDGALGEIAIIGGRERWQFVSSVRTFFVLHAPS